MEGGRFDKLRRATGRHHDRLARCSGLGLKTDGKPSYSGRVREGARNTACTGGRSVTRKPVGNVNSHVMQIELHRRSAPQRMKDLEPGMR
jgi:hypothetical protein